jgi:hypothetical protein
MAGKRLTALERYIVRDVLCKVLENLSEQPDGTYQEHCEDWILCLEAEEHEALKRAYDKF